MRIPYTVPRQTLRAYECSKQTQRLKSEQGRQIQAECKDWDARIVSSLKQLSVEAIVDSFRDHNVLQVLPDEDFHRLLECLPVTLPLEITVPFVPDGEYWKRCAQHTWSSMNVVSKYGNSWRRLVVERTLEHELEEALPAVLEEALRVSRLAGHLVRRVCLRRLLQTAPLPSGWTSDRTFECRELPMLDSELETLQQDLQTVLEYLVNLEELDIMFGMHDFEKNLSEAPNVVKVHCCQALGKALSALPAFSRLRVHRSQMHIEKLTGLLEPLYDSTTLTVLDLRSCYLGDRGVQIVAAFVSEHPALSVLRVANNKFGARGATYISKALLHKTCAPLIELDISLNTIGDVGGHNVMMALVPRDERQDLHDPADDEDVRALMLAEEKEAEQRAQETEGQEPSHEGVAIFRGLVARAMAGEARVEEPVPVGLAASSLSPAFAYGEDPLQDWETEQKTPRVAAILAGVVEEARHQQQEMAEEEARRIEEEQLERQAAAAAADRWEGAPERLLTLHMSGCKLSAAAAEAIQRVLNTNRVLTNLSLANNHLGGEACAEVVRALQTNPRVQQLDMRMCGASWEVEAAAERALRSNQAALRRPLRLQDMLREREEAHRTRMATTAEVLGRQWERGAPPRARGQASAVSVASGLSGLSALSGSGLSAGASRGVTASGSNGSGESAGTSRGMTTSGSNGDGESANATNGGSTNGTRAHSLSHPGPPGPAPRDLTPANNHEVSSVSSRPSQPRSRQSHGSGSRPSIKSLGSKTSIAS